MQKQGVKKEYFALLFGAVLVAFFCGCTGALFAYALKFANRLFGEYDWLLYLLPLGGVLSVLGFKLCKIETYNIHSILNSVRDGNPIPLILSTAVFIGTFITQIFGGSAGKEGAALQIGGGIATPFAKVLGLKNDNFKALLICGMSAMFSSVFALPLTALAFGLEIIFVSRKFYLTVILPLAISTFGAFYVAKFWGVKPESFKISIPSFSFTTFMKAAVVITACAVASYVFCVSLKATSALFKKLFTNNFVRIIVGGVIIVLLTIIVKNKDYNGGGMHIIEYVLHGGQTVFWAFALKILFTSITNAAGFKGGEIVPAMFIGATLGCSVASFVGLSPIFGAALGIVALFGGATKCIVSALFLGLEMFGYSGFGYFAVAVVIAQIVGWDMDIFNKKQKNTCNI